MAAGAAAGGVVVMRVASGNRDARRSAGEGSFPQQGGVSVTHSGGPEAAAGHADAISPVRRARLDHHGERSVKASSCVGNALMVDPDLGGGRPLMFICGAVAQAKRETETILTEFGWETVDLGGVEAARAIEPLCMLWCPSPASCATSGGTPSRCCADEIRMDRARRRHTAPIVGYDAGRLGRRPAAPPGTGAR